MSKVLDRLNWDQAEQRLKKLIEQHEAEDTSWVPLILDYQNQYKEGVRTALLYDLIMGTLCR